MFQYSFEDVMRIDQALHQLATYEVTKGMIVVPKSQEEFMSLHDKIAQKFNYFKQLVQSRECTLQYIKQNVLQKNGPFPQSGPFNADNLDPNQIDELDENNYKEKNINDFTAHLLKSFAPPTQEEAENILDKIGLKVIVKSIDLPKTSKSEIRKSKVQSKKIGRKKSGPKKD